MASDRDAALIRTRMHDVRPDRATATLLPPLTRLRDIGRHADSIA